jgi:hypothetical protein
MQKKILGLLFLIFILGYFLRVMFLPSKALTFGYDQARDAMNALEIVHGHIKIFGPSASQPGLFHGVFYYYVLAPFYAIGSGNPLTAAYGIAFINCLTILIVFYLSYLMTKKTPIALVAAFLFAISFEATQYATWLSNPTLGIVTVPLMYLGLWIWIQSKPSVVRLIGPIIAALGLGLSIQSEIFLAYHIVPVLIWVFIARKSITRKQVFVFLGVLILTLSTMILAQLKFGIGGTLSGIRDLVASQNSGNLAYEKSLGDYLILYLNQVGRIFSFNSYPGNVGWGSLIVIAMAITGTLKRDKKVMFLATWLFSHLSVVTVGGASTPFLMVGIGPGVAIIIALYLGPAFVKGSGWKALAILILLILAFGNISTIIRENKSGSTLFSIQKDMLLSKQIDAIDYTYQKSQGKSFSINTLTSPLWVNIVWTYLYKWHGQNTYGYVPTWHGRGQEGQIDTLMNDNNKWKLGFLIIEPMDGIPMQYLPQTIGQEDSYSKLISEKDYGTIRVQERTQK